MCFFKCALRENADPHTSHEKGFSPVCVRMWLFNVPTCENADPHISQEKGFSPVCECMWLCKCAFRENADPHISQEKGFSLFFYFPSSLFFKGMRHQTRCLTFTLI